GPAIPTAGESCIATPFGFCGRERTADRDRANLSVLAEPPFDRPAAMDERQAAMGCEIVNRARHALALQIGRSCTCNQPMWRKQPCHQARVLGLPDPDRNID